jgi:glycosyltransferase involved in cell wall biosynthesis
MTVEFCLPVYNEESILKKNILLLLEYCRAARFDFAWSITIAVNGSGDKSLEICRELQEKYPQEVKVKNFAASGKGAAIINSCLESRAEIIVYMDIDLSASLEDLPALIKALDDGYDLTIGSRLLPGSKTDRSFIRNLSSKSYNWFSRLILKHDLTDLQCGFKACRTEAFKKIAPFIKDNNWFFDTELIFFAYYLGYKVKEIPISWSENKYQQRKSKIRLVSDSLVFIRNLLALKARADQLPKLKHV